MLCFAGVNDTVDAALHAAFARNGADHNAAWYAPVHRVTVDASGDANPTFPTNAAGLPLLTSRGDGAGLKIFLDFDGNGANLPFGLDADDSTFNADEQLAIYYTWRDIISFFSPFNVNVTTIQPATGGQPFAWHLTSKSISGGYAYVNSLSNSGPTGFNEAGNAVDRHSGIAHELGHILSLTHQSEYDKFGAKTSEYTDGFSVRDISIIGVDYGTNVRNWIYGRNSDNPGTLQSDVTQLAGKVASVVGGDGFRPDDFGATTASAFTVPAGGTVDADLERPIDVDLFKITVTAAGPWQIDATPTYESAVAPKIELLDSSSNLIAARDDSDQRGGRNNDVEIVKDLVPGTYYVRVSSSGDYSEIGEYVLTAAPLPSGMITTDIPATIDRPGTAAFNPATGTLTQLGAGTDIWSSSDQFRFTYDTLTGDGQITTRVASLDNTDPNAKAGIMFRASNAANSVFAMMSIKPGGQVELITRASTGAAAASIASAVPGGIPLWLRLGRVSNGFTASYSSNGTDWTQLGTATLALGNSVLLGLATTSHNTRRAAYASFDNISLTGALGETAPSYNALPSPANLTVVPAAGANTSLVLNWADVERESGYAVERSVDGVNFVRLGASIPSNVTSYTDGLPFGSMRWWYRVIALSGTTGSVPGTPASGVNKPSAPTVPAPAYALPAISLASATQIYLNWSDVQGDNGYRIERSTDGTNFTQIATTIANLNAYNDNSAAPNTTYAYRITPITSVGDGLAASLVVQAGTRWTISGFGTKARSATSMKVGWADFPTETGYRIERSLTGLGAWSNVATLGANVTSWTDTSISQLGKYYYRIYAVLPIAELLATSVAYAATLPAAQLPTGWASSDIGTVGGWGIGGSTNSGTTYKVIGGGTDIGGSLDSFHYLYRPLNGDGSITVRVDAQQSNDTNDNAEAGVMIRQSLTANSAYAYINVEPGTAGRTDFETRDTVGGGVTNFTGITNRAPVYMRLTRSGSTFTAEASTDGSNWTLINTRAISMSAGVYIGMAVTAAEPGLLSSADFSTVSITGDTSANQKPTISSPATATPSPITGTTTTTSVIAADDAGEADLIYTWSAISIPAGKPNPTFASANGTNAGKSMLVTFGGAGFYTLRATITDAGGLTTTSDVTVNVQATLTSLSVSPANASVLPGASISFFATGLDQFGDTIANPTVTWSAYGGTITSAGVFTAGPNSGTVAITATAGAGAISASTNLSIAFISTSQNFIMTTGAATIRILFNSDPASYLSESSFVLTNLTTGVVIPTSELRLLRFGNYGLDLVYFPGGILPDGQYRLTASNLFSGSNEPLAVPISYDFGFLRGDVTGDGLVNFDDLLILAQNYGQTANYLHGDVTGDGNVNFDDLLLVAQRYGMTLNQSRVTTSAKRRGNPSDSIVQ